MQKYLNINHNKVFFQIGTNTGVDEFRELVSKHTPSFVVLVEPWQEFNESIEKSYLNINKKLINGVVDIDHNKHSTIYLPDNNKARKAHSTLIPMQDWDGNKLTGYPVTTYNFNIICQEEAITEIELLMIDTEGYDFTILDSIDFTKIDIKNIIHESWEFNTESCYENHENINLLGIKGQQYIKNKLLKLGFTYKGIHNNNCIFTKD
jgi:hypothetical protein